MGKHASPQSVWLIATASMAAGVVGFATSPAAAQGNPQRDAFFGQTHVHTSWSFDAYVFGNTKTGPEDAYKYALGQPIEHPAGYMVKIKRPIDFQAVTDHSEYAGTIRLANDPGSAISKLPIAEKLKVRSKEDIQKVYLFLGTSILKNEPIKELIDPDVAGNVWKRSHFDRRQVLPARQVHDVCRLRMDIDARQPQHAPQHHFQELEEGAGSAIHVDRFEPPRGFVGVDGRPAQGGQRAACHFAQCEPLRRHHVSDRGRQQRPADRRRMGAAAGEQRAAIGNEPAQGHVGNPSDAVAQRRIRQFRNPELSARRRPARAEAQRQLHPRGLPERSRDAGHPRLQPLQVRSGRRERLPRHRRRLYAIELFRRAWALGRNAESSP